MGEIRLMSPVAALSRGLRRTRVVDGRIVPVESEEAQLRRGFTIAGQGFVLEENPLLEVLDAPRLFPVPNAPRACRGVINLRGTLVPVFDIRRLIGGDGGSYRWVLVIDRSEEIAALVVDGLPTQIKLSESNRVDRPSDLDELAGVAVSSGYRIDNNIFLMLNHKKLLQSLSSAH